MLQNQHWTSFLLSRPTNLDTRCVHLLQSVVHDSELSLCTCRSICQRLPYPFVIRNFGAVIQCLEKNSLLNECMFSLDMDDLFYSVPHSELFTVVRNYSRDDGATAFMNACFISVSSFLELIRCYLESTFVKDGPEIYIQK